MKYGRAISLAFVSMQAAGCFGGALLTQAELTDYGSRSFDAPRDRVFKASVGALRSQGYEIAVENPETGLIKTTRKVIRADAESTSSRSASAVSITRTYALRIEEMTPGKSRVTASPRVFRGDEDLSDGPVWALEGQAGERQLWANLFREIQEGL